MIHCMIFWFFSASSDGPGASVLLLFPNSAFLEFLLEVVPAFPLQEQGLVTCYFSQPRLDGWPGPAGLGMTARKGPACTWGLGHTSAGAVRLFRADSVDRGVQAARAQPPVLTQTPHPKRAHPTQRCFRAGAPWLCTQARTPANPLWPWLRDSSGKLWPEGGTKDPSPGHTTCTDVGQGGGSPLTLTRRPGCRQR